MSLTDAPTSYEIQGRTVTLPVEVRVASSVLATWLLPPDRVRALIEPTGRVPFVLPGVKRAMVSVVMVKYVDSDLGPYNEFGVNVMVEGSGKQPDALIHQLPVNQGFTLEAGRSIWGFPKFMTDSTIEPDGRGGTHGTLRTTEGETILELRVAKGWLPLPNRTVEIDALSFGDGTLRRTPFSMRTDGIRVRPGGAQLEIGSGHPMADELRDLHLGRPLSVMSVSRMSATFGPATPA